MYYFIFLCLAKKQQVCLRFCKAISIHSCLSFPIIYNIYAIHKGKNLTENPYNIYTIHYTQREKSNRKPL